MLIGPTTSIRLLDYGHRVLLVRSLVSAFSLFCSTVGSASLWFIYP